nr:immunoglobulin heavy chain junction region [Mus musculus]
CARGLGLWYFDVW